MSTEVSVDLDVDGAPMPVGTTCFHFARTQISTTFIHGESYLAQRWAYAIDPVLPLSSAPFSVSGLHGASATVRSCSVGWSIPLRCTTPMTTSAITASSPTCGMGAQPVNLEPDHAAERQTAVNGAKSVNDDVEALVQFGTLCHLEESAVRQTVVDVAEAAGR